MRRSICAPLVLAAVLLAPAANTQTPPSATDSRESSLGAVRRTTAQPAGPPNALIEMLVSKGVLTAEEARKLDSTPMATSQQRSLAALLRDKGVLTAAEYDRIARAPDEAGPAQSEPPMLATTAPVPLPAAQTRRASRAPASPKAPEPPSVIAAVAPIRVLPVEAPKREGLIPEIQLGSSGARLQPYGLFKTSLVNDTSSPYGNDFPLPGFIADSGPDAAPEFHVKARSFRIGSSFEWLDRSAKWTLTGKVEADFEGNFSRVNNRNISSIRSNMFQLRLAYARLDRTITDKTSVHWVFGQDWTPFGSSTLPNIEESTGLGLGFGILYERLPQVRFGVVHDLGGSRRFKISPEIAVALPAFGNVPTDAGNQLGYGERQGADSDRPEVQGRIVAQFQLDKAPAVAPAQLIASFVYGQRRAIVTAAGVPAAFKTAFPNGAEVGSHRYGYSVEAQLPTRVATLLMKYYNGQDLRFYFVGNLFSNYTDTSGLTGTAATPSIDGASNVVFGLRDGIPVVAPQRPVRAQGGFVNVAFPLSRLFNANPKGRNAGWSAYLHYSYDYALARDVRRFGGGRSKSDLAAADLQYKLNSVVSFVFEQSLYRTRAANHAANAAGGLPLFRGIPSFEWHDIRSELATVFTF